MIKSLPTTLPTLSRTNNPQALTKNGFEQKIFLKLIKNSKIIGTEISDTASKYENTVQHDFHDEKRMDIIF